MLRLAGVCAFTALGCGSDDDPPTTVVAPQGAGSQGGGGESGPGVLNPENPANGGSGDTSMIIGLFDGEDQEEPSCVDQFAGVSAQPPVIQFVVDTSGSMTWVAGTERLPAAGEQSKWEITRDALALAISNMPDAAAVGVSYYPNTGGGGGGACYDAEVAAPIERLTAEQRTLIERANSAQRPQGGTPTHAAYEFGVEQLEDSSLPGSRFLVLITDGIPTYTLDCGGDGQTRVDGAPLVASVGDVFRDDGVRTFVIGSPGSEAARDELSQMALVGGTGAPGCEAMPGSCHFDMTGESDFSAALSEALGDITEATLGCDYAVPQAPMGRGRINYDDVSVVVESGGVSVSEFERATGPECESGWQYNADRTSIQLCRSTCDDLKRRATEDPDTAVRVKFGCSITPA